MPQDESAPWDPCADLVAFLASAERVDQDCAKEVLDAIRLDAVEAVAWIGTDRRAAQVLADRLAAVLRGVRGPITKERVIGGAGELLELLCDMLARSRPASASAWIFEDKRAGDMLLAIADKRVQIGYAHLVRAKVIPRGHGLVRRSLEEGGLIVSSFGRHGYRFVMLTAAGWELVPYLCRQSGRLQMPVPPDDGRFSRSAEALPT